MQVTILSRILTKHGMSGIISNDSKSQIYNYYMSATLFQASYVTSVKKRLPLAQHLIQYEEKVASSTTFCRK